MRAETGVHSKSESGRNVGIFIVLFAAALVAGIAMPGQQLGVNLALVGAIVVAVVAVALRAEPALLCLASIFLVFFLLRSAGWVGALNLVTVIVVLSIAAARARSWPAVFMSSLRVVARLPHGIAFAVSPVVGRAKRSGASRLTPVIQTLALAVFLVAVFGALFLSADPAFASLAERVLVPGIDLSLVPARAIVAVGTLALAGSLASLPTLAHRNDARPLLHLQLAGSEWKAPLVVLDVLFAAFVAVQLAVLFGGHDHVLRTSGLTYAEYARQGFFQLVVVAVLTLGVIAATLRFARAEGPRDRAWLKLLLGALCLMTLVILASAAKRMGLYQEAYGFTRLRLLVDVAIVFLGGTFVLLLAAGVRWRGAWVPRASVTFAALTLIAFNGYNPDAKIAQHNVDRFLRTGDIDMSYLASLSPDAVPQLMRLPEPERSCVVGGVSRHLREPASFWSWNAARERARSLLHSEPPLLCPRHGGPVGGPSQRGLRSDHPPVTRTAIPWGSA